MAPTNTRQARPFMVAILLVFPLSLSLSLSLVAGQSSVDFSTSRPFETVSSSGTALARHLAFT